jgi:hypothetical protein
MGLTANYEHYFVETLGSAKVEVRIRFSPNSQIIELWMKVL